MPLIAFDPMQFAAELNRRPFSVRHALASHPAFRLERLIELARRMPAQLVEYNAGDLPITQDPRLTPRTGLSAEETIRRIAECRSWMVLKRVEEDPEYRRVLDDCLDEIGPLVPGMRTRRAFIFVSSPGSVTPYHIDHEYNFLLQIGGHKSMSIFDRSVVSEEQLERFYRGEHRNLVFPEHDADRAQTFELGPGDGVHVPVNAPHYVRNGAEASISFSITFRTPEGDRRSAVYVANDRLRRLGLKPRPVGTAPFIDRTKYLGYSIIKQAQRRLGRG
jgi:ribosomal protein L16 Arg81 hydroxylase